MSSPIRVMAERRAERRAALAAAQLAALQRRQGQTDSATVAGRVAAQAAREQAMRDDGALYPGDVLISDDVRIRRAARDGVGAPMVGFHGAGGSLTGGAMEVDPGHTVTRAPTVGGVCVPELLVTPGQPYTATAVVDGDAGFVGLQWVSGDGVPLFPVSWGRGPGDVQVTGVAPEGAFGVRMLLVCWADPAATTGEDRAVMDDLQRWLTA